MKKCKVKKFPVTSFYLTPVDEERIAYLSSVYGLNRSQLIRMLVTEAYTLIKYVEQK